MCKIRQVGKLENKSFEEGDCLYVEKHNGDFVIGKFKGFAELNLLQKILGYNGFQVVIQSYDMFPDGFLKVRANSVRRIEVLK